MIVYLVTGLLACIFAIASGNAHEDERSQNLLWALAFLVLFIPSALRYGIGTDYTNIQGYVEVFDIYANGGTAPDGMDVGFVALIKLIALFTRNPQWLFVVSSAIICGFELRACRRLSCNAGLSVALLLAGGLYLESFNIMRQWIAIAIVMNAFEWVGGERATRGRRCFWRYAIWVGVAATMHMAALVWIVIWPLFSLKLDARRCLIMLAVLVAVAYLGRQLLIVGIEATGYGRYLTRGYAFYIESSPSLRSILTSLAMFAFCLWALRGEGTYDRWTCFLMVTQVLCCAILLSELFMPMIVDRLARYFIPLMVLQLPFALRRVDNADLRHGLQLAVVASWVLVTFLVMYYGGQHDVFPYQSVLSPGIVGQLASRLL